MAKRKHYDLGPLRIPEPEEVALSGPVLRNVLGTQAGFVVQVGRARTIEFVLTGSGQVFGMAGRVQYRILPFLDIYWLALVLQFESFAGTYGFKSASIVVFRGQLATGPKEPLFRAEWDHTDPNARDAQPHWHVYTAVVESSLAAPEPSLASLEEREPSADETSISASVSHDALHRFHFASAASWHEGNESTPYIAHTPEGLKNWLHGCLVYTRKQLEYIASRTSE